MYRPAIFHHIEYLAKIRNKALEPLYKELSSSRKYDKIVFMNDVLFCKNDILELIYQSDLQGSDFTCPLDIHGVGTNPPQIEFRDGWVARDIKGGFFYNKLDDLFDHEESKQRISQNLPFQVQSSWNGVAVLNAEPFYLKDTPIRFRRSKVGTNECSASECSLICNDFWSLGYGRIIVVPKILVSYNLRDVDLIDANYMNILKVKPSLEEKIKYIPGPEEVACRNLLEYNVLNASHNVTWTKYLSVDIKPL
ncbi:Alpha-1,3-mannosyltransferase CMT1 [Smittium culicis]|uniref:Alpha-1,3-mannosyltransferase CMT1 n=1 Tax=Smittium culicis TaxID=133412 RepID=A0A1R1X0G8_9FUNG|nr:Alpha-1,3-mannosyltransferase CMT1 [Smittium culicis]